MEHGHVLPQLCNHTALVGNQLTLLLDQAHDIMPVGITGCAMGSDELIWTALVYVGVSTTDRFMFLAA